MGSEIVERGWFAAIGALGGLSLWAAIETWDDGLTRPVLFATVLALVFFFDALMLAGQGRMGRAFGAALAIAVAVAALTVWASLRFEAPVDFLAAVHPLAAVFVLAALPIPFLIARMGEAGDWRHYPTLFVGSWALVLRAMAAMLFVGIVWLVLTLFSELLELVDIDVLKGLMRTDWFGPILSGAAFGLGLAVLGELSDIAVPRLVLRLLRVFLPVALVVGLAFLAGLPFRGLSGLFGGRSTAGVLMTIAFGAIGLISVAAADSEDEAVRGRLMRGSARGLALLLPVIAALAAWAVWLRVRDYGWTPERIVAALGAAVVAGYAVTYALSALRRGDWMAGIRRGNVRMALGLGAAAALWLTPLFDTGAISVRSQAARFQAGQAEVKDLPIWEMQHDWGRAGPDALDAMLAEAGDNAGELGEYVTWARTAENRWADLPERRLMGREWLAELQDRAIRAPEGAELPGWFNADLAEHSGHGWKAGCGMELAPDLPGCAIVVADFALGIAGDEVMVLTVGKMHGDGSGSLDFSVFERDPDAPEPTPIRVERGVMNLTSVSDIMRAVAGGDFTLVPRSTLTLKAGGIVLEMDEGYGVSFAE